ncbi:MAG: hypothetical protein K8T90_16140 [Planctomycetes bacterium]|nr:hypothetical protein [Planctomycetota bacterium]
MACTDPDVGSKLTAFELAKLSPAEADEVADHLLSCARCFEDWQAMEAAPLAVAARVARKPDAKPARPRRRWAAVVAGVAATLLLAFVATGAAARVLPRLAGILGLTTQRRWTQTEASRLARLDLVGAGIAADAEFFRDVCDVHLGGRRSTTSVPGTLVAFITVRDGRTQTGVSMFGADGRKLWRTGDAGVLPSWDRLLAGYTYELVQLRVMTAAVAGDRMEEVGIATIQHGPQSALLLFDPATGRERGIVWHDGHVALDTSVPPDAMSPAVLPPQAPGGSRHLLVVGADPIGGPQTTPCAVVFDADGHVLQHLRFPSSGARPDGGSRAVGARVFWPRNPIETGAARPSEVSIFTSEEIEWVLDVKDGLLVPGSARAAITDAFPDLFDRTAGGRRFAEIDAADGGLAEFLSDLNSKVRGDAHGTDTELWGR